MEKINIKKLAKEGLIAIRDLILIYGTILIILRFSSRESVILIETAINKGNFFIISSMCLMVCFITFVIKCIVEVIWWIIVFLWRKNTGYKF